MATADDDRHAVSARTLIALLAINVGFISAFTVRAREFGADGPDAIDLQLSMQPSVFNQIVQLWGPPLTSSVIRTIVTLDFLFPLAYAALLSALYIRLCRTELLSVRRSVAIVPWLAAACDWIENALTLWLLSDAAHVTAIAVRAMSIAAVGKFALLTVAAGFITAALMTGDRGRVLAGSRYSVLSLLVGSAPILALGQGRDLLLALSRPGAEHHAAWFIAWMVVWAFSVWYWSRILLDADADPTTTKLYRSWALWVPRLSGSLTLLIPGIGFLLAAGDASRPGRLRIFGFACIVLSAAFLVFLIYRRRLLNLGPGPGASGYDPRQLSRTTVIVLAVSIIVSAIMFVWLTFGPLSAGGTFGALAVLTIAAANTVFLGSVAVFLSRSKRVPIEIGAFACAAVFSLWNDNHDIRLWPGPLPQRQSLTEAFDRWLPGLPSRNGEQTVVLVAGEGGGIRAAYWTSLVLHALERDIPEFSQRLFAISSVSGSSFGAGVYAALQKDYPGDARHLEWASATLREPFLAPMIAKLVSGDFFQWFLPWPVRPFDRSRAMEDALAASYERQVQRPTLKESFLGLGAGTGQVPLLFLNGTSVQAGRRIVTSPVQWSPFNSVTRDPDPLDLHQLIGADLSVSAAVHNTARFPYISAAGRLRTSTGADLGHIVDGGYFENTGADTLLDVLWSLRARAGADARPVRFVALALVNSPMKPPQPDSAVAWRDLDHLGEWFAPLRGLLQTRNARGEMALRRLKSAVNETDFIVFQPCQDANVPADRARVALDAPLAWQLSAEMIESLESQLERDCFRASVENLRTALAGARPSR